MNTKKNPVVYSDYPDPDIIRVGDTYYMASTTMHYIPGCDILRSYDLMNWELVAHAYDVLERTPGHELEGESQVYGQGMWAPSFRYHQGTFYITFTGNDTHKTYLLTAKRPEGPWEKRNIEGFYYDNGLFFDDDGRVYIVHGQKTLWITELDAGLNGPKKGGMNRIIAQDQEDAILGYEGSHLQKHNGRYYLFTCHMLPEDGGRKTQVCFAADSLEEEFQGKCIINDDMGYHDLGVAQGGMIDTPDGDWYLFMFQDKGALGRAPVMIPMHFEDGFPAVSGDGKVPPAVSIPSTRPEHRYEPLNGDDDFVYRPDPDGRVRLKLFWQFNHNPHDDLWSVTEREGAFRLRSGKVCASLPHAYNTLTQRAMGPECAAEVTVDCSAMKDGDYAGISAFLGCYGALALVKEGGAYSLVMFGKPAKDETVFGDSDFLDAAVEYARVPVNSPEVRLKCCLDFTDKKDEAAFFYQDGDQWLPLGIRQKLYFKMDHFTGCRFGLFLCSTKEAGGYADFQKFRFLPAGQ